MDAMTESICLVMHDLVQSCFISSGGIMHQLIQPRCQASVIRPNKCSLNAEIPCFNHVNHQVTLRSVRITEVISFPCV